ncbi:MAG: thioredoxin family protein [Rhodopirellula sp.]|nr:thioredoxin family protein [Rhodopirellula sp.]
MATIRLFLLAMLMTLVTQVTSLTAGKYNLTLSPGDAAPAWNNLLAVDGKKYSLSDFESSKAIVVVFTCNSCPYAVDVEDRLLAFHQQYGKQGVALVAINVNNVEADLMPAMKEKAKEKAFQFPYLFDETQKIAKDYGAKRTPEFFVLDQDRKIVYMGALDDSPEGKNVSKRYVEAAVDRTLAGEKIEVAETIPVGCAVRFERTRRTRRVRN